MKVKTNYKIIFPIVVTIIMIVGCFVHSMEFEPQPTFYYIITVLVGGFAFAFGGLFDSDNNKP